MTYAEIVMLSPFDTSVTLVRDIGPGVSSLHTRTSHFRSMPTLSKYLSSESQ